MKNSHFMLLLFSLSSVALLAQPAEAYLSKEHYKKLDGNLERLFHLRQGVFRQKNKTKSGELKSWYVNSGQDSVMLYTVALGNKHRDGYWLLHYQFMSNLPDMPVYTALEHITEINRDSLHGQMYKLPVEVKLSQLLKKPKKNLGKIKLDLEELEALDEEIFYWKRDYNSFEGHSLPYFQNQAKREEKKYTIDYYYIHLDALCFMAKPAKTKVSIELVKKHIPKVESYKTFLLRSQAYQTAIFEDYFKKPKKR
ncbi:hypothetical protein SapgrDRAFT_0651 [Saprospira grandis DSM 2844]|uniref:Outer membrane lipoprotein-sorting protein n=1 Tax=Saprospira grandis DSM 2844 TaxID=694433 RepID=J0NXY9_9BACT|nr:hypothetical protein [Saprospira grandis]EJF52394.1 hypothetical protein SapgrDRAFT_0651 [Saprospira grandis DSM 2844]